MAAGVTERVWDMNDVAALIAARESPVSKPGQYSGMIWFFFPGSLAIVGLLLAIWSGKVLDMRRSA